MSTCTGYYSEVHGLAGFTPINFWVEDQLGNPAVWNNFQAAASLFNSAFAPGATNYIAIEFANTIANAVGIAEIDRYDNFKHLVTHYSLIWPAGAKWAKWTMVSNLGTSCVTPLALHSHGTTGPMPNTPPP